MKNILITRGSSFVGMNLTEKRMRFVYTKSITKNS